MSRWGAAKLLTISNQSKLLCIRSYMMANRLSAVCVMYALMDVSNVKNLQDLSSIFHML